MVAPITHREPDLPAWLAGQRLRPRPRRSPRCCYTHGGRHPPILGAYFALLLYGAGSLRRRGPAGLALLAALLFPLNTREGLKRRDWFGAGTVAFERDLASGASTEALAVGHHAFLLHWDEPLTVTRMPHLGDAGFVTFRHLPSP